VLLDRDPLLRAGRTVRLPSIWLIWSATTWQSPAVRKVTTFFATEQTATVRLSYVTGSWLVAVACMA
jgi:hypothetical protein